MAILRALAAGEGYPGRLAKFRYPHYKKSEREIAEQLTGHWREDHLFSLQQALKMYDAIQERIADYEREILRKPGDMEREELRGQPMPAVGNAASASSLPRLIGRCRADLSLVPIRITSEPRV
jgi:transposase